MALMFGAMQVAKKIPFDDNPDLVTYARIGYISAQLLCLGVFYFCSIKVSDAL
jgi:Phosphate transport (Pho88)